MARAVACNQSRCGNTALSWASCCMASVHQIRDLDRGANEEICEGAYNGYVTEQSDEVAAAREQKDASMVKLGRAYGGCLGAKRR